MMQSLVEQAHPFNCLLDVGNAIPRLAYLLQPARQRPDGPIPSDFPGSAMIAWAGIVRLQQGSQDMTAIPALHVVVTKRIALLK